MPEITEGQHLNQYVAPQLLHDFRNFKTDFMGVLRGAPQAAIAADGIRFNKLNNNVEFLVNNTETLTAKPLTGKKVFVEWERYDTTPTSVTDEEMRALPYDKRSETRRLHTESFQVGIRDHVIYKLCPEDSTSPDMPVMRTTGSNDGTGRLRLTFADLVKYLEIVKGLNLPLADQLYMVLNPQHSTDLIIDRDSAAYFANQNIFFDAATGKVKSVMGFKFFENNACPAFNADGQKLAKGAALTATDRKASLFFYAPLTLYHLNSVKILYKPETLDTHSASPTSEFRTQTYGLIDRILDYGFGAIVSGIK